MTELQQKTAKHVHIIGIGGSAMAPLAGMLRESGFRVTGSDSGVYPATWKIGMPISSSGVDSGIRASDAESRFAQHPCERSHGEPPMPMMWTCFAVFCCNSVMQ